MFKKYAVSLKVFHFEYSKWFSRLRWGILLRNDLKWREPVFTKRPSVLTYFEISSLKIIIKNLDGYSICSEISRFYVFTWLGSKPSSCYITGLGWFIKSNEDVDYTFLRKTRFCELTNKLSKANFLKNSSLSSCYINQDISLEVWNYIIQVSDKFTENTGSFRLFLSHIVILSDKVLHENVIFYSKVER